MGKAHKVLEELMRSGFDMSTKEFFQTTLNKILKKYRVIEQLTQKEYCELLELIIDRCAENDLKNMGIEYLDDNDWKDK